jgi:hypothetical protein
LRIVTMHGSGRGFQQTGRPCTESLDVAGIRQIRPDIARIPRSYVERWWTPDYVEHFIDGLRKAGLEVAR